MASFVGTFEEFIKYINPRVKNVVNSISRAYKQEVGRCEHCNSVETTLEAAHVTGRERPVIIEEVLQDYINGEIVTVDLEVFENRFKQAHDPIPEVIKVLCRPCHRQYDNQAQCVPVQVAMPVSVEVEDAEYESGHITNAEITDFLRRTVPQLPEAEIEKLLDYEQCKRKFDVNFSVLKEVPLGSGIETIRRYAQVNGRNRWSTLRPILVGNRMFLVLTQWYERNRRPFLRWKEQIGSQSN
jgi:hypothetical protein